ncbi:MAG TPA: hypothetical protein VJR89_36710 [Polyangiales bacterium]|nr:hypothetical protein [Polyangiales bacterium]
MVAHTFARTLPLMAALAWTSAVAAQEDSEPDLEASEAATEPAAEEPEAPAAEPPPAPGADAVKPGPADHDTEARATIGPIEHLGPEAYPDVPIRGLKGGSLWLTFHGLQWPYMPRTSIGISGYAWIDTGYERVNRGNPSEQSIKYMLQQGRFLLRVTPTFSAGEWFGQAQAEIVANKDQSLRQPDIVDADDVWIRAGKWNVFDVQLGRFEGWEVYHFGMGLDLNTLERQGATDGVYGVPEIYGVTYAFYRPPGVGQAAVHLYPLEYLRIELAGQVGNEFGSNTLAGRPVGVLDLGWLKLKVGGEYKVLTDQKDGAQGETTRRGVGAGLQFVFDPFVELGVNGGYALVDRTAPDGSMDEKGSFTTYSIGGFANARIVEDFLIGVGANYTYLHDLHYDEAMMRNGEFTHTQAFVALQYVLWGQLYLKVVGAYALGDFSPTFGEPQFQNKMLSGRLRVQYLF